MWHEQNHNVVFKLSQVWIEFLSSDVIRLSVLCFLFLVNT